jgi:hypothetical protein
VYRLISTWGLRQIQGKVAIDCSMRLFNFFAMWLSV